MPNPNHDAANTRRSKSNRRPKLAPPRVCIHCKNTGQVCGVCQEAEDDCECFADQLPEESYHDDREFDLIDCPDCTKGANQ